MRTQALVTLGALGLFGFAVFAAEKPPEDYQKAMQSLGGVATAMSKPDAAADLDAAKKHAATAVAAFDVVQKYWTGKSEDAVRIAQVAKKAAQDMDVAAGQNSAEGVDFAFKEMVAACQQCHMAHREKQPDGTFLIK